MYLLWLSALMLALVVGGGAYSAHRWWGWYEARTRIPVLPSTIAGKERWMAALPVRVVGVEHRLRERGDCTCRAVAFTDQVGQRLSLSASSLAMWHGSDLVQRVNLGHVRMVISLEQAYGLLTRNHYATTVDNFPIPGAWRHRLRLVFADLSSIEFTAPGRSNARIFVDLFTRLHRWPEVRILGTLAIAEHLPVESLRHQTGLPARILDKELSELADNGCVLIGSDTARLTDSGRRVLASAEEHLAINARYVLVDTI